MLADEHNLDRGKLEIEVDLVAICAPCEVQIVELERLTNVIISLSSSNNMGLFFCWYITQSRTPRDISFYAMRGAFVRLILCLLLPLCRLPPHFSPLIILHQLEGEGRD